MLYAAFAMLASSVLVTAFFQASAAAQDCTTYLLDSSSSSSSHLCLREVVVVLGVLPVEGLALPSLSPALFSQAPQFPPHPVLLSQAVEQMLVKLLRDLQVACLRLGVLRLGALGQVNVSGSLFGFVHSTSAVRFSGELVIYCWCELTFGITFACSLLGPGHVL